VCRGKKGLIRKKKKRSGFEHVLGGRLRKGEPRSRTEGQGMNESKGCYISNWAREKRYRKK